MTQVCGFVDDTMFYSCDQDLNALTGRLERNTAVAVEQFEKSFMKLNQGKCHLLASGDEYETVSAKTGEAKI